MDIYSNLVPYLSESSNAAPPSAGAPPNLTQGALSMRTGIVLDNVPGGSSFGKVLTQPNASYYRGSQVSVKFQGANPRVSTNWAAVDSAYPYEIFRTTSALREPSSLLNAKLVVLG